MTFTLKKGKCPQLLLNSKALPQATDIKYLGLDLAQRLTWQQHIVIKSNQLSLKLRELYWLIDKSSKKCLDCKLMFYKTIIKPVWTYGTQIWRVAVKSNIQIIQRFQKMGLRRFTESILTWIIPWSSMKSTDIASITCSVL